MDEGQAFAFFKEYAISHALNRGKIIMRQILMSNTHSTSFGLRASRNEEEKHLQLKEFPEIANALATADPKVLRELYKVLYLTDETHSIEDTAIINKILEFSGFSIMHESSDFFIRELMLINMPTDTLRAIKKILCIPGIPLLTLGQKRMVTFIDLLRFLENPTRTMFQENLNFQHTKYLKPKTELNESGLRPSCLAMDNIGNSASVSPTSNSLTKSSAKFKHKVYLLKRKLPYVKKASTTSPMSFMNADTISDKTTNGDVNSGLKSVVVPFSIAEKLPNGN